MGLPKAVFYACAARPPSACALEHAKLRDTIQTIFTQQRNQYGAPRIYQTLRKRHSDAESRNRTWALMRVRGLRAKAATDSGYLLSVATNLLGQDFG